MHYCVLPASSRVTRKHAQRSGDNWVEWVWGKTYFSPSCHSLLTLRAHSKLPRASRVIYGYISNWLITITRKSYDNHMTFRWPTIGINDFLGKAPKHYKDFLFVQCRECHAIAKTTDLFFIIQYIILRWIPHLNAFLIDEIHQQMSIQRGRKRTHDTVRKE